MVITSSTQWTIPLNGSSLLSASSPCLARQGSVLGLKTCQPSAPELHLQDPHSTSSRRLQATEFTVVSSRRSAGSFRQLIHEDLCPKLAAGNGLCPSNPDWAFNGKESESKYDGIALPWSCSSHHPVDGASDATFNANLVDVHEDITADDVDLLPMPGLLSYSFPFYANSCVPHAHSVDNFKRFESSSSESSANSSKSSATVPDYLGLPPHFDMEVAGMVEKMCHASAPLTPPISVEHARDGGNGLPYELRTYDSNAADSFADSLAGLWSNSVINGDSEHLPHGAESLASIFNVYPQNFHEFSASEGSCIDACDHKSVQLVIDDLQYLVNPSTGNSEGKTGNSQPLYDTNASVAYSGHENHRGMVLEATQTQEHVQSRNATPTHGHGQPHMVKSTGSGQKSPIKMALSETSAFPHGPSSTKSNIETASPLSKETSEPIGTKRPLSVVDFASMATSMTATSGCSSGSNAWRPQPNYMGLPVLVKEDEELHGSRQKDPKLAALHFHLAMNHGSILDEDNMPKPPPAKVRRKHGTAMDPQSVAARTRRERFSDRIRILQSLVPNGERLDTVSMLGQTLEYVRFLQHQVWQLYHGKDPVSSKTCEKWKDFVEAAQASTV